MYESHHQSISHVYAGSSTKYAYTKLVPVILLDVTAGEVKFSPHYLILKTTVALTTFCLNITVR